MRRRRTYRLSGNTHSSDMRLRRSNYVCQRTERDPERRYPFDFAPVDGPAIRSLRDCNCERAEFPEQMDAYMRKPGYRANAVASLRDDPRASARRILEACIASTMSFWIDDQSIIHADLPDNIPSVEATLIVGTYGVGTPMKDIEDDLRAERVERARSWSTD